MRHAMISSYPVTSRTLHHMGLWSTALCVGVLALCASEVAHAQMGEKPLYGKVLVDQLELGVDTQKRPLAWDMIVWAGGDWNRLVLKSEGELPTAELSEELSVGSELQVLYDRLVLPFWAVQVGVRGDVNSRTPLLDNRAFLVIGMQGLVPYRFEFEPSLFISQSGDVSARLRMSYDLFITQRLIAQPAIEANVAVQSVPEFGVGRGLNDIKAGLRLRYEFSRKFAPYLGINWERAFFETARLNEDEPQAVLQGLLGVRAWF